MIFYEQSSNVYNKQGAQNYLDIIRDDNLTEILEISDFRKAYLKSDILIWIHSRKGQAPLSNFGSAPRDRHIHSKKSPR